MSNLKNISVRMDDLLSLLRESSSKRFVIQMHDATNLHYDFRLEMDGALKSWAIPKKPSVTIGTRRLAIKMPDHDLSYINYEGDIPEDEYGAGHVSIWDKGTYDLISKSEDSFKIKIKGAKLDGTYALFKTEKGFKDKKRKDPEKKRRGVKSKKTGGEKWLLVRVSDEE